MLAEPVLALMAAIFGGVGLKVIEAMLARGANKTSDATRIRDELRKDNIRLREEIEECDKSRDELRHEIAEAKLDYHRLQYDIVEAISLLKSMLYDCNDEVKQRTKDFISRHNV